ncbi:MAG: twin-arginine translocase TatA/TatE family subunit [Gammaproteobacteria bacterium]|jgi:sec-independent protein translocase protein TatA
MGAGGISIGSLVLILLIVIVLFGTKKLRNIGSDVGGAIKSFKKAMNDGEAEAGSSEEKQVEHRQGQTVDAEVVHKEQHKND